MRLRCHHGWTFRGGSVCCSDIGATARSCFASLPGGGSGFLHACNCLLCVCRSALQVVVHAQFVLHKRIVCLQCKRLWEWPTPWQYMTACFRSVADTCRIFSDNFDIGRFRAGSIEVLPTNDAEREAEDAAKEGLTVLVDLQRNGVPEFVRRTHNMCSFLCSAASAGQVVRSRFK